jgi:hypothetical protein
MTANIVHIGYHKTATTWFQEAVYPRIRNYQYVDRTVTADAFLSGNELCFDADRARSLLNNESGERPLILCEEELSGNLHNAGLYGFLSTGIAERIHEVMPDSRIVIVIRNQADIIASAYNEYIKEGGTHSVDRYLHPYRFLKKSWIAPYKYPLFGFEHFEFYPLIERYEQLFGKDHVDVYLYEEILENNLEFLRKMSEIYNFEVTVEDVQTEHVNVSWGARAIKVARFVNMFTYGDVADKYRIFASRKMRHKGLSLINHLLRYSSFRSGSDTSSLLGEDNLDYILHRFQQSNERIRKELRLPLDKYGYP